MKPANTAVKFFAALGLSACAHAPAPAANPDGPPRNLLPAAARMSNLAADKVNQAIIDRAAYETRKQQNLNTSTPSP